MTVKIMLKIGNIRVLKFPIVINEPLIVNGYIMGIM